MKPSQSKVPYPIKGTKTSVGILTCDPYLETVNGKIMFRATSALCGYYHLVVWDLTPVYAKAIEQWCSADDRDETTEAIIEDIEGAAEWDKPKLLTF